MLDVFLSIWTNALLPLLGIAGFGYLLQRWRPMEAQTLVTLNLYFLVPVYLFVRVLESTLSWWDIAQVGIVVLMPLIVLASIFYSCMTTTPLAKDTIAAFVVGSVFANAGNFGLPVAELAFGPRGGEVHAVVVLFANFSVFSIAYAILAMGKGKGLGILWNYFKLPYFYCIVAAVLVRDSGIVLPRWILTCCHSIANGLIPVALVTLGAQLASRARWPNSKLLISVLGLKLVALPLLSLATVWLLGLWPWPGVVVVLAATAPTAINPLLLAMQLEGDTDTLSDCVFWTTLLSAVTVAIWMTVLKLLHAEAFV